MQAFGNFLRAKRPIAMTGGLAFVLREVVGGMGLFVQTRLPGGSVVPAFTIQNTGGIISTTSNGMGFWLNLDNEVLDTLYSEFQSTLAIELQEEPTTVQEGVERVAYLNAAVSQLKSILSMG